MRPGARLVAALAGALAGLAAPAGAQIASMPHATYTGRLEYAAIGSSLRPNGDAANPCAMTSSGDAVLSIPSGATVVAAWVYWAGSGPADWDVRFNSVPISASRTATTTVTSGGSTLSFFGGAREVTSLVTGSGTMSLSQLAVLNQGAYCDAQLVLAGWELVVIYSSPSFPQRTIQLRDGFGSLQNGSTTIPLPGFGKSPAGRLTLLTWDGDVGTTGGEEVAFNGTPVSSPPGNAFNDTYGMDMDSYDVSALLDATPDGTLRISTGSDLVFPHLLVSQVDAALVDVTPDGLGAPPTRLGGASYSQAFSVENRSQAAEGFDLLARAAGTLGVIAIDSIVGAGIGAVRPRPDSARVTLGGSTTASYVVWFRVLPGAPADASVYLMARSTRLPTQNYGRDEGWAELRRASPILTLAKSVTPNANIGPGTELTYEMTAVNAGTYAATAVSVRDEVPTQVDFKVGSTSEALPAGMTSVVSFSTDGGTTWTYAPISEGCGAPAGYDRCVRAVRWSLTGSLAAGGTATAVLRFVARVP